MYHLFKIIRRYVSNKFFYSILITTTNLKECREYKTVFNRTTIKWVDISLFSKKFSNLIICLS